MQPIKLEIFLDDKTLAGMKSVEGNIAAMESVTRQVIENLKLQLKDLEKQYKVLQGQGLAGDRELADIQAMQGAIGGLKDRLKELQKAKQQTNDTPIVDEQAVMRQTNSLKMQFSQVARELPSLAMGPQMFILAISNNLPYLADAIKDVRVQNEALSKSGQKATPVWKQLLSAAGSWQTMLVVGITLLTVYGKEIWEWTKGLFNAKDAIIDLSSAENEMALARQKASESIKKEQTELDILYSKLKNTAVTTKERIAATNEWIKRYPEYANILSGENVNLGKLETAYKALSKEIYANAVARHYADKIGELSVKQEKEEIKRLNQKLTVAKAEQEYERLTAEYNKKKEQGFGSATAKLDAANKIELARRNVEEQKKIYNDLIENVNNYGKNITTISNHIQAADLFPQPQEGTYDYWKQQQENAEGVLKEIKSNVKKTLDDAAKEGKDLFSLGIDKSVVETYKKAVSEVNEAKKQLKIYDDKDKKTTGKTPTDYQNELSDARVRAQQKIEATRIAVMADGYKKRQKLARQEMDEEIARIDKEERDTLKKMQDKKKKGGTVTPEQENQVKDTAKLQRMGATEIYIKDYLKIEQEGQRDSLQSWADYTKEYGTYQEKRLAIELEYNQKIADINELRRQAQADGDAEMVKQQDIALAKATKDKGKELISMDYTQLIQSPDYVRAFENLKETSTDTLGSLLEQFENAKQTAAQVLSPDQLREYTTTIQEIMDELDSRNPFQTLADRKKELAEAEEELAKAQQQLNAINKNDAKIETGVKSSKYNQSTGKIESEKQYLTSARALEKYNKAQNKVAKSGAKVEQAEKDVQDVVNELSNSFKELGDAIGGQAGEIISLIGDIGTFAMTAMNGVTTASTTASEAVKAVEKASVILAIIGAAIQIATKIASMFKDDDGVAEYERAKEVYESYIDILDRVIEKQKELFELNSRTGEQAYEKAKSMVKQQEDASRDLGKQYLDSGASKGFLGFGSSASEGTKQRKDISSKAWNEAKKVLGNDFYNKGIGDDRMTGLFDLSVEQLKRLQEDAPLFWAELKGDTQKYLQQIIDCNEELTKLENDRKEGLVKTDFDSFLSSFTDTLMDMDSSSKDFADNFEEYLKKAILSSLITEKYKSKIKQLYNDWATATGSGNELTEQEAKALKERQEKLAEEMLKDRQGLADVFGWKGEEETSSQSGRSGAFETMTQEQGTKLEGLFTALQDHTSAIHKLLEDLMSGRDADKEIFMQIAENTAYCKFLEQMYEIMERQERDGMKLKG